MAEEENEKKPKLDLKNSPAFQEMYEKVAEMEAKIQEYKENKEDIGDPREKLYDPMNEMQNDFWPDLRDYADGEHQILYPKSDLLRWKLTCKDKKMEGVAENVYPTSQVKRICNFKDGLLEGEDQRFLLNGKFHMVLNYSRGKINGIVKIYSRGLLASEVEMIDDKLGGWCKNYHDNGNLASLIRFKNDKRDGVMEVFHEEGYKQGDISYKDDLKHGPEFFYYQNGSIQMEDYYEEGLQEGESKTYYPSGMLMQVEKFSKGISVTHSRMYDTEGRLMQVD